MNVISNTSNLPKTIHLLIVTPRLVIDTYKKIFILFSMTLFK